MKSILSILLACGVLFSCSQGTRSQGLTDALSAYEADPSQQHKEALIQAIYVQARSDNDPEAMDALQLGEEIAQKIGDAGLQARCLHSMVQRDETQPLRTDRILRLIQLMEGPLRQPQAALALKRGFVTAHPDHAQTKLWQSSLPAYTHNVDSMLAYFATRITSDSSTAFNIDRARDYVNVAEGLVLSNPADSRSAEYLFNAANVASTIRDYPKALGLYDWIMEDYKGSSRDTQALFMKAFTYDAGMKSTEEAGALYRSFISQYPEHALRPSAEMQLENLGLSEAEILKKLQEKNAAKLQK